MFCGVVVVAAGLLFFFHGVDCAVAIAPDDLHQRGDEPFQVWVEEVWLLLVFVQLMK